VKSSDPVVNFSENKSAVTASKYFNDNYLEAQLKDNIYLPISKKTTAQ
jgi:hypothetical protein